MIRSGNKGLALLVVGIVFFLSSPIFASSIELNADKTTLAQSDTITLQMILTEDGEGDFIETPFPNLSAFSVLQQNQSSSNSYSFVNGKSSSKKTVTTIYLLAPLKKGKITIHAVRARLKNGKTIRSNSLSFRIGKGISSTANPLTSNSTKTETENSDEDENSENQKESRLAEAPSFGTPLSKWEARTRRYFVRVFVRPLGSKIPYQGIAFEVSYYLYTKRGAISNIDVPQFPDFKNSWVEEIEKPSRLAFHTVQIKNTLYDYALLKRYLVIPDRAAQSLEATQMVVSVASGGFFGRKKKISSIALSIPLAEFPNESEHTDAIFGSFEITPNKTTTTLTEGHLIDSVSFIISGCGSFSAIDLALKPQSGLKIFPPDVKSELTVQNGQYCGKKKVTFMLKGLKKGTYSLEAEQFEQFDGTKYKKVKSEPITIIVDAVAVTKSSVADKKTSYSFEFLPTLPETVSRYHTGNMIDSLMVKIVIAIPIIALCIALFLLLLSARKRRNRASFLYLQQEFFIAIDNATNATDLINIFYKAFAQLYKTDIKGMRKQQRTESDNIAETHGFIQDLQSLIYGGIEENFALSEKKTEAKRLLTAFGAKK